MGPLLPALIRGTWRFDGHASPGWLRSGSRWASLFAGDVFAGESAGPIDEFGATARRLEHARRLLGSSRAMRVLLDGASGQRSSAWERSPHGGAAPRDGQNCGRPAQGNGSSSAAGSARPPGWSPISRRLPPSLDSSPFPRDLFARPLPCHSNLCRAR
jgi:hypothetical protein